MSKEQIIVMFETEINEDTGQWRVVTTTVRDGNAPVESFSSLFSSETEADAYLKRKEALLTSAQRHGLTTGLQVVRPC